MQPYLFPYFPYIQLLAAVDTFIILDTVQFIARGWSNRNKILLNKKPHTFVIPVQKHPRDATYADIRLADNITRSLDALKTSIQHAYSRSPYYNQARAFVEETFPSGVECRAGFSESFQRMALALKQLLTIDTEIVRASTLASRTKEAASEYIIDLVKQVGGDVYINAIGGKPLYQQTDFVANQLDLRFLYSEPFVYSQTADEFVPDLSIIDLLANLSAEDLKSHLSRFTLR
ncbi:MAG: WbqC family protein [Hyphomonas sp.]|nr:WbqC family protein [Hyphomonas sp.]